MVKSLQETKAQLIAQGEITQPSACHKIQHEMSKASRTETNAKRIEEMRISNLRSTSLASLFMQRSQAMITSGESVILAERLSRMDRDEASRKNVNIFELTSPRNEGESLLSPRSSTFLPSLGMKSQTGVRSKMEIFKDFQSRQVLQKDVAREIYKDREVIKRKRSVLLNDNLEMIRDKPDSRAGKKHRRIKMDTSLQQPLYTFDQTTLEAEKVSQEHPEAELNSGIEAYSRVFDIKTQEFVWKECTVLTKVAPGKFAIRWKTNNKPKVVERLNLKLKQEMMADNPGEPDARLQNALALQYESLFNTNLKGSLD